MLTCTNTVMLVTKIEFFTFLFGKLTFCKTTTTMATLKTVDKQFSNQNVLGDE